MYRYVMALIYLHHWSLAPTCILWSLLYYCYLILLVSSSYFVLLCCIYYSGLLGPLEGVLLFINF